MKRLFVAIHIQPNASFTQHQSKISYALRHEKIKWVEPKNMHLTLKFFGETDERKIPALQKALDQAVAKSNVFSIHIENMGIFGSRYDPKVLWFGIRKSEELLLLWRQLIDEFEKIGWLPDRQNFVPHLTIGRIKEISDKPLFQKIIHPYKEADIQQHEVSEIILYESILNREGPVYIKQHVSVLKNKEC